MRRRIVGAVISVGLGFACTSSGMAEDEPPPLAPPGTGGAPVSTPPPAPAAASSRPAPGPVLAVPGSPGFHRLGGRTGLPTLEPAGSAAADELPPLTGPAAMPAAPPSPVPAPALAPATAPAPVETNRRPAGLAPRGRPLTIESVPAGDSPDLPPITPSRSLAPRTTVLPPRRLPGLFSRFGVPPLVLGRGGGDPGASITVEPRSDPAAEAAVKRRVERQISESFGDRLKSVEVRVVGRDVTIRARATRFWQRRSLRRSLESLPTPSGYRTTVDLQ
jgi:hypothetical protein